MRHEKEHWTEIAQDVARWGVAKACELHGIHRATWYRRRKTPPTEQDGIGGRDERTEIVLQLALERPQWGCDRIAYYLGVSGVRTSSPTVQKILVAHGLGRREQREAKAREKRDGTT